MTTVTRELGREGMSSPEYRPQRQQRFLALDTMRGVAILMVIFGHFLPGRVVFGPFAHHVTSLGRGGVLLFFLLSGYLIFRNVERQDTAIFLSRRLFKIFPAYTINVALIFLFGLFTAGHENWNLKLLLANLFMVQDVFGQDMLNGVYWTLLIEIKFYVFIALQYLFLRDRGTLVIPLVLISDQHGDLADAGICQPAAHLLSDILRRDPDLPRRMPQLGPHRDADGLWNGCAGRAEPLRV